MAKQKVVLVDEAVARLARLGRRPASAEACAPPVKAVEPAKAIEPAKPVDPVKTVNPVDAPETVEATPSAADTVPTDDPAVEVERLRAELAVAQRRIIELEQAADIDVLLEVINRRGFERVLRRSAAYVRRYGTPAALVYLDLDYFKPLNDRYGHAVGDLMLQAVAKTLQRAVRESDVVARLGGDEFGVLLWNLSEIQAAAKARALEAAIAATVVMHGEAALSIGVSAGFAMLGPGDEPRDVISRADMAMYARKRAGRARAG
jgi:diguanylate cyclase (GGDEF)-like protein